MNRSTRAAAFVLVCLLTALIGAVVLYLLYSGSRDPGVALLAGSALVAFTFAVLAIRVSLKYRRSRRLELEHNVPPSRTLRALELRQWLILTLGIAFVAVATGAGTALRVVNEVSPAAARQALSPAAQPTTEAATTEPATTEPATTEPTTTEPTTEPTTSDPESADPTADPTDTPVDTPATKYLDAEPTLEGSYVTDSVSFSATRYSRGVFFDCGSHDDTRLSWNVAGYKKFTAVAGIDDRTDHAIGATVEFLFYDQDGRKLLPKPAEVSVGHAQKISIDLTNVVSLRLTCAGRDTKTGDRRVTRSAFGDPIIVR